MALGAHMDASITPTHRCAAPATDSADHSLPPYACVRTSKTTKNTEFWTILEMGLLEAYPGWWDVGLAYTALKDTAPNQILMIRVV